MKRIFSLFLFSLSFSLYAENEVVFNEQELIAQSKTCGCLYACTCDPMPATKIPCTKAFNAPLRFSSCWGYFTSASFIYWRACEQNIELGIFDNYPGDLPVDARTISLDFSYRPSFKVQLGMQFCHDTWNTYLEYTRYHETMKKKEKADPSTMEQIFPLWLYESATNETITALKGRWHISLDTIDWYLARHYYVGQYLTYRSYFGLRGAFIDQRLKVKYTPASNTMLFISKNRANSWGVGPRMGLDAWWGFCGNFRVFGDASGGILYTDYKGVTQQVESYKGLDTDLLKIKDNQGELRYDLNLAIGLGWEDYLSYDRWHIDFTIGYDFLIFFNQNIFRRYLTNTNSQILNGDLYLHGLTVKLGLDF